METLQQQTVLSQRYRVQLPIAQEHKTSAIGQTIMVVEDDPAIGRLLLFHLREAGYNPIYAPDGLQALTLAARHQPALVILDVMLPGLSGWEVCSELRQSSNVPIMMLTSKSSDQDMAIGLNAGADDYLAKPFSGPLLVARIQSLLRRATKSNAPAQFSEEQTAGPVTTSIFDEPAPLPGTQLRRARRSAQMTLLQVERTTGIRWDYLQALEQEDLGVIPHQMQRTIFSSYAAFLGLNPEPLWTTLAAAQGLHQRHRSSSNLMPALMISIALLGLMLVLLWVYLGRF